MAKNKMLTGVIAEIRGCDLILTNGHRVVSNLMRGQTNVVGAEIVYAEMASIKTVRFQAGHSQWTEQRADHAKKFYKQG